MTAAPLPPRELAAYVTGGVLPQDGWEDEFDAVGAALKTQLLAQLPDGLADGARVLDFGCGSGRLLRHLLGEGARCEIHGCDIDGASVAWVQEHLCPPLAGAHRCPPEPPLAFEDAAFDVVLAVSVFSQMAVGWEAWLLELRRLLRPGGLLVLTLMGPDHGQVIAGRQLTDEQVGMSVHGSGRPWAAGGPMVLHSGWWVRAHYGRAFTVRGQAASAAGQDLYVLERPAASVAAPSAAQLADPEPGEARELSAARHDVDRLQREFAALNAAHDAYAAAYAEESRRNAELRAALDALDTPPPSA